MKITLYLDSEDVRKLQALTQLAENSHNRIRQYSRYTPFEDTAYSCLSVGIDKLWGMVKHQAMNTPIFGEDEPL